jgi:hypothetical protein
MINDSIGISMKKVLVCSQNGLGDLFFALFLAKNLSLHGSAVTLYYGSGCSLDSVIDYCKILPYPSEEKVDFDLALFDEIYLFYHEENEYVKKLVLEGKKRKKDKFLIIYPYPTPYVKLKPFFKDSEINPEISLFENIQNFLIKKCEIKTPICFDLLPKQNQAINSKSIVLHVTSSNINKDWPIEKFIKLAERLIEKGYEVHFFTKEKKYFEKEWKWLQQMGYSVPLFDSLIEVMEFLSKARLAIGVDSGICHFASVLQVPAIIIGRRKNILRFWQPKWSKSAFIAPSSLVPNFRWFRLRDRFWKHLVTVKSVEKKALEFLSQP